MQKIPGLYVNSSERGGRGVFSTVQIPKDSLIEICPVIVLSAHDTKIIHKTKLHDYYFQASQGRSAIVLGYGSIYNHSDHPNAEFKLNLDRQELTISSITLIEPGEEILINYRAGDIKMKLWFDPH